MFRPLGIPLALCALFSAAAQQPTVRWNVIALDSRGQSVADLTRDDLQVQDAGREQPLVFFHPVGVRATLVLFDLLNADITNRAFATDEIVRALQGREASDSLYFYLLTPDIKLQPVHAFPNSPADLTPAATPWTRNIRSLLDDALKGANRLRPSGLVEDDRVRRTYEALTTAVSTMTLIPGHKNIVWISRGVPIALRVASGGDEISYRPLLRKFSDACARANVAVFPVNPSTSATPSESELASVETLQQIANLTGGRLFTANSIGKSIAQTADARRGAYTLAYVPSAGNWDGKSHKLKIATTRKGVDLLFPESYTADRPDATAVMRGALQSAVSSPFDSTEMRIHVAAPAEGQPLQVHVNSDDALITAEGGRFTANLVMTIVDYGARGPVGITPPSGMNVTMTDAQHEAARKSGILLTQDHPVKPGVERVRVIVYDPAAGLLGSTTIGVN